MDERNPASKSMPVPGPNASPDTVEAEDGALENVTEPRALVVD